MDGVLVFSEDAWFSVFNETLVHFGHAAVSRAEFDAIYGNGAAADRDAYMAERTVAEIDAAYARLFEEHLSEIRPNVAAPAVLAELRRRGIRTSVTTNTTAPLETPSRRRRSPGRVRSGREAGSSVHDERLPRDPPGER